MVTGRTKFLGCGLRVGSDSPDTGRAAGKWGRDAGVIWASVGQNTSS